MIDKVALGTVQFGLDYGINNKSGQIPFQEISKIIELCKREGLKTIDTAYVYGNSEERLGEIGVKDFKVVSKLPICKSDEVFDFFKQSLKRLEVNYLEAYMLHNFSIFQKDKKIWKKMEALKKEEKVKKIGVSLYNPEELEMLWEDGINVDIVQIAYNLFDRRFDRIFPKMKEKGIEVHARSTFLQGLFFKSVETLPIHFEKIKTKLSKLKDLNSALNISMVEACLGFVINNPNIDKVVIGVDSLQQLENNIACIKGLTNNIDWQEFQTLGEEDINIINPSLWK